MLLKARLSFWHNFQNKNTAKDSCPLNWTLLQRDLSFCSADSSCNAEMNTIIQKCHQNAVLKLMKRCINKSNAPRLVQYTRNETSKTKK